MGLYIIDPYPGGHPAVTDFELGGISHFPTLPNGPRPPRGHSFATHFATELSGSGWQSAAFFP